MISDDREDFKRWSAALRTTGKILKYDRPSIFGVIQNVPSKDTYHFPESLRRHIDSWLAEHGQLECVETDAEKTGKQLAAARGEYVEGISDPNDPKWVKTDTQPQDSIHNDGTLSRDGTMPETASNEGEKTEVAKQETVTEDQAEQARETLNNMGYGVYATSEDTTDKQNENLSDKVKKLFRMWISSSIELSVKNSLIRRQNWLRALMKCRLAKATTWSCGKKYSKQMSALPPHSL